MRIDPATGNRSLELADFAHYRVQGLKWWRNGVCAVQVQRRDDPPFIVLCRAWLLMFAGQWGMIQWEPVDGAPALADEAA